MDTKLKGAVGRVLDYLNTGDIKGVISVTGTSVAPRKLWGDDLRALVDAVHSQRAEARPTDLSKRLREWADTEQMALRYANIMRSAAAEIDVYYGGMLAWKRTAEQKDSTIIEMREQLKAKEVALGAAHARLLEMESPPAVFRNDGQEPDWKAYAREEGRLEGIEQAAKEADHWQQINPSNKSGEYIAAAIRGLATGQVRTMGADVTAEGVTTWPGGLHAIKCDALPSDMIVVRSGAQAWAMSLTTGEIVKVQQ